MDRGGAGRGGDGGVGWEQPPLPADGDERLDLDERLARADVQLELGGRRLVGVSGGDADRDVGAGGDQAVGEGLGLALRGAARELERVGAQRDGFLPELELFESGGHGRQAAAGRAGGRDRIRPPRRAAPQRDGRARRLTLLAGPPAL
ncbi:MAG: hypothetical protein AVDCRST_MAG40-939 [uncultured Gemmatimonadaceae bacterium]|uniref:Uncharacterized protein n=1 Tax=uncultured Gemmatimonadaceae bacterium TaxID=246130 RepID=A0A6J4KMU3_9BACT|nr:MAG: hypothetical protein AVDCRST_MAG40-939 [uncultured Gemmatimonadaceae bacterium]